MEFYKLEGTVSDTLKVNAVQWTFEQLVAFYSSYSALRFIGAVRFQRSSESQRLDHGRSSGDNQPRP